MTVQLVFPGSLTPRAFLAQYWQRRPLLLRGALGDLPALSAEELAGLACEDGIESRIVLQHGTSGSWEVRHGPFDDGDFARLPETGWTLLVQDVDKFVPGAAGVLRLFRFIPDWRTDDVMISYAVDGGSVGPHTDDYDVFLVQASGRRRWQIQTRAVDDSDLLPDLDLRILSRFAPEQQWTLEPGDVLYLPPGVAHWGVAEGPCMTWSVGFRAPSAKELGAAWLDDRLARGDDPRYRDPGLGVTDHPGEVPAAAVAQARRLVRDLLQDHDGEFARWFCAFLSEPKEHLAPVPPSPIDERGLERALGAGRRVQRNPAARLLFHRAGDTVYLAASGNLHTLPARLAPLAHLLADSFAPDPLLLVPWLEDPEARALLLRLFNDGQLESHDGG
jgi:50S ribosomal protein L16 3-hydroxylase